MPLDPPESAWSGSKMVAVFRFELGGTPALNGTEVSSCPCRPCGAVLALRRERSRILRTARGSRMSSRTDPGNDRTTGELRGSRPRQRPCYPSNPAASEGAKAIPGIWLEALAVTMRMTQLEWRVMAV